MYIDVTKIIDAIRDNETRFSASIAETGLSNIGAITYRNACEFANEFKLNKEEIEEYRDILPEYGAWDKKEIKSWSDQEVIGLFIQFVSSEFRELFDSFEELGFDIEDYSEEEYRVATENGGGNLYKVGDSWIYYVGM